MAGNVTLMHYFNHLNKDFLLLFEYGFADFKAPVSLFMQRILIGRSIVKDYSKNLSQLLINYAGCGD